MGWFWGLFIILIGIITLGLNTGWWNIDSIIKISRFWPLLLILLGISLIFKKYRWSWAVISLSFLALIGFIYYAAKDNLAIISAQSNNTINKNIQTYNFSQNLPAGVSKAEVQIDTGAIDLKLRDGDSLIKGELQSNSAKPNLTIKTSDSLAIAKLQTPSNGFPWAGFQNNLTASITNSIPVKLTINAGASKLDLGLRDILIEELNIGAGASNIELELGKINNNAKLKIEAGVSDIAIKLPKDIGFEIITRSGLSPRSIPADYIRINNTTYRSSNYDNANIKAELTIVAGVSSINITN